MPGMQAAFVDIGIERSGFIHLADVLGQGAAAGSVSPITCARAS
jgi:Ribonuclease G/E